MGTNRDQDEHEDCVYYADNYAAFRLLQVTAGGALLPPPAFFRLLHIYIYIYIYKLEGKKNLIKHSVEELVSMTMPNIGEPSKPSAILVYMAIS